jgi:hypothetical protein
VASLASARPSTSSFRHRGQDVDARNKSGHDARRGTCQAVTASARDRVRHPHLSTRHGRASSRPSTSSFRHRGQDVDARNKSGHDARRGHLSAATASARDRVRHAHLSIRHGRASSRPSTSSLRHRGQDVDARNKSGHDARRGRLLVRDRQCRRSRSTPTPLHASWPGFVPAIHVFLPTPRPGRGHPEQVRA